MYLAAIYDDPLAVSEATEPHAALTAKLAKGERAAVLRQRFWSIPQLRLRTFTFLPFEALAGAVRLSRDSWHQAVRVLWRDMLHEVVESERIEYPDPTRLILYRAAIRSIAYLGDGYLDDCLLTRNHIASLVAKYPSLMEFHTTRREGVLVIRRSGPFIHEAILVDRSKFDVSRKPGEGIFCHHQPEKSWDIHLPIGWTVTKHVDISVSIHCWVRKTADTGMTRVPTNVEVSIMRHYLLATDAFRTQPKRIVCFNLEADISLLHISSFLLSFDPLQRPQELWVMFSGQDTLPLVLETPAAIGKLLASCESCAMSSATLLARHGPPPFRLWDIAVALLCRERTTLSEVRLSCDDSDNRAAFLKALNEVDLESLESISAKDLKLSQNAHPMPILKLRLFNCEWRYDRRSRSAHFSTVEISLLARALLAFGGPSVQVELEMVIEDVSYKDKEAASARCSRILLRAVDSLVDTFQRKEGPGWARCS